MLQHLVPSEPLTPQLLRLHLAIAHAFKVFDHEQNNTVDVRELGTVIRSLGCCPSEAELHDIIMEVSFRKIPRGCQVGKCSRRMWVDLDVMVLCV